MANKSKQTSKTSVEYFAIAKTAYKNSYGEIAIKKGQQCKLKKFDEQKYKETGTVNFVMPPYCAWGGGCAVYKNIQAKVKKVTTIVTTTTEVTEEEV